ncbi:hypothetical protein HO794_03550 [Streptococcus suis]|nr:hypothetical protein [Streptococcus suis]HEM5713568.1 hypothetical protein [Streptococcus suis]
MEHSNVLQLVKMKEGIKSDKRDKYLTELIKSSIDELEQVKGIAIDLNIPHHVTFVADWTYYQYINKDQPTMPRYLQQKLHDYQITYRKQAES